jgi:hypothetical protein
VTNKLMTTLTLPMAHGEFRSLVERCYHPDLPAAVSTLLDLNIDPRNSRESEYKLHTYRYEIRVYSWEVRCMVRVASIAESAPEHDMLEEFAAQWVRMDYLRQRGGSALHVMLENANTLAELFWKVPMLKQLPQMRNTPTGKDIAERVKGLRRPRNLDEDLFPPDDVRAIDEALTTGLMVSDLPEDRFVRNVQEK